jgi:hypothetical protein
MTDRSHAMWFDNAEIGIRVLVVIEINGKDFTLKNLQREEIRLLRLGLLNV